MAKSREQLTDRHIESMVSETLTDHPQQVGYGLPYHQQAARNRFRTLSQRAAAILPGQGSPKGMERHLSREDNFFPQAQEVIDDIGIYLDPSSITPSDRVFMTDMIVLFGLLTSGRLDTLYERKVHHLRSRGYSVDHSEQGIMTMKTDLAVEYLEKVRNHLRERANAEQDSPVVVGYEIEYRPLLQKIIEKRERFPVEFQAIAGDVPEGLADLAVEQNAVATSVLERLSLIMEDHEGKGKRETKTYPSASIRTQQAEITSLLLSGGLDGNKLVVHETMSGITLSPEHTEVMDWLAIEIAAGLIPYRLTEERLKKMKAGKFGLKERYAKVSYLPDGTSLYIPYHTVGKERTSGIISYPAGIQDRPLVERRSAMSFTGSNALQKFNVQARASFLAAWGIRAIQQSPDQRTEQRDIDLAAAWINLQSGWQELLEDYGLQSPSSDPKGDGIRFWFVSGYEDPKIDKRTEYENFLDKIRILQRENKSFRVRARQLVQEYQMAASKLIESKLS